MNPFRSTTRQATDASNGPGDGSLRVLRPPPNPAPYALPEPPRGRIPSLSWICLHLQAKYYWNQIDLQGVRLHYDPTSSDILQRSLEARPMDPRFWVTVVQIYDNLPASMRTHSLPLLDSHVPLLQQIPSNPLFSLITVLDLPQCPQIEDKNIHSLARLHNLVALDISATTVSSSGIKILADTLQWVDGSTERRGPWLLRILRLRKCFRVNNSIDPHLLKFPLLSVLDLRGTACTLSTRIPFRSTENLLFFYPNPLTAAVDHLWTQIPPAGPYGSNNPFILSIDTRDHPPRSRTTQVAPENSFFVVPSGSKRCVTGNSVVFDEENNARLRTLEYQRAKAVRRERGRDKCFNEDKSFDDPWRYLDRDSSFNSDERGGSEEEEFSSYWYSEDPEDEGTDTDGYESFDNAQVDPETFRQLPRNLAPTTRIPSSHAARESSEPSAPNLSSYHSAGNATSSQAPPSVSSNSSTSILSNHASQTMRMPTLMAGVRLDLLEPASQHGAQLEVPPRLRPCPILSPPPRLERIIDRNGIDGIGSLPIYTTPTSTSPVPPTIFYGPPPTLDSGETRGYSAKKYYLPPGKLSSSTTIIPQEGLDELMLCRVPGLPGWTELERAVQAQKKDGEAQMKQRQSLKQQIATGTAMVDRSRPGQGHLKSQIVAQARMEALRESARRKSIPVAPGTATGTTIPVQVDRNPFKKTSQLPGECLTTSNESGRKILKRISEVSVPIFPKHLIPGSNTVRRRKEEKEENLFDSRPSESPGFFYASTLPNEKKGKISGFRPSSSFMPSSIKPGGQKPDVKPSRLNKKRALDETDSKASPHKDKRVKHVASNGLVTGAASKSGSVVSKIPNEKKTKSVDRRASAPGSFDWAAWGKG